ncbi:MAG TPA: hypothetical protein VKF40_22265 [Burkholderiales bacterium]|nr:hypothetical protein [Burkholderiales bacterium]
MVNTSSHGRVKRFHAEFRGDEAVEIDILEVMLRLDEVARTRIEADTRLVRLALKALNLMMTEYSQRTGQRYPTYTVLMKYLDEPREATAPEPARVVNLPKSSTGSREQG